MFFNIGANIKQGNFPHFYSESKKGRWSIKQDASKSQRIASPPPPYREWPINMATGTAGNEAKWKIDQEHDLLGLGGQFNIQVIVQ
jgi:hypothetical protein